MRSDIAPGGTFPDYELPDHTDTPRKLSELQGDDPMILTLARGHYCPKEHQQHLELAAFQPKIAVAYTQIVTIATDEHHTLQEFRASVGAQWTFLSDPGRTIQQDLDIQEYTDPDHDPMIPHTLVLKPGLVVHSIYNGYWFWGRPSVDDLWRDLRAATQRDPPGLGPEHARAPRGLGRGRLLALPRLGQAGRPGPVCSVTLEAIVGEPASVGESGLTPTGAKRVGRKPDPVGSVTVVLDVGPDSSWQPSTLAQLTTICVARTAAMSCPAPRRERQLTLRDAAAPSV